MTDLVKALLLREKRMDEILIAFILKETMTVGLQIVAILFLSAKVLCTSEICSCFKANRGCKSDRPDGVMSASLSLSWRPPAG